MEERVVKAAKRFFEAKGYEIMNDSGEFDVVAYGKEDNTIIFIDAGICEKSFGTVMRSRESFEDATFKYLTGHTDKADVRLRYDVFEVKPVGSDYGLVRHHIDALSNA